MNMMMPLLFEIGHGYREQRRLLISRLPISAGICLVRINLVEALAMLIMV